MATLTLPPHSAEHDDLETKLVLAVLSVPADRRPEFVAYIVNAYADCLDEAHPDCDADVRNQSIANFIGCMKRRFQSLQLAAGGHVGHA